MQLLPCLHTFCESCLRGYIPAHSLSVACFICGQQSIVPLEGVSALQDNQFILNLMVALNGGTDCLDTNKTKNSCSTCDASRARFRCNRCLRRFCLLCARMENGNGSCVSAGAPDDDSVFTDSDVINGCDHKHELTSLAPADSSEVTSSRRRISTLVCRNHDDKSLEFYCSDCETAVCEACTQTGAHLSHAMLPLPDAIFEHKSTLTSLLDRTAQRLPHLTRAVNAIEQVSESLTSHYHKAEIAATQTFDELARMLEQRKQTILSEITSAYEAKMKMLTSQVEVLKQTLANVKSCCDFTEKALQCGNETEVRKHAKQLLPNTHVQSYL